MPLIGVGTDQEEDVGHAAAAEGDARSGDAQGQEGLGQDAGQRSPGVQERHAIVQRGGMVSSRCRTASAILAESQSQPCRPPLVMA